MDSDANSRSARSSSQVQLAIQGNNESLKWVIRRYTPVLLAQADYRLSRRLRQYADPEDIVQDVWISALPHLPELHPEPGREAATLLRYLGTAILRRTQQLAEKHLLGKPDMIPMDRNVNPSQNTAVKNDWLEDSTSSPASKIVRSETRSEIRALIDALDPEDREILILRGIEQWSTAEAAATLGLTANAVAVRYHRAVKRLRERIPDSVFQDFADESPPPE